MAKVILKLVKKTSLEVLLIEVSENKLKISEKTFKY